MDRKIIFTNGDSLDCGTIFCVASNYSLHAKEMGTPVPAEPSIFIKPPQALIHNGDTVVLPEQSSNVHHEVELVVCIGKDCGNINAANASDYIAGYAVGIDVTMRDVQSKAKTEGKPWAVAKGFRTSAPVSDFVPSDQFDGTVPDFGLSLYVNGELKQNGNTSDMERSVITLVEYLSKVFSLRRGDLIFTGTPEGVGKIVSGDVLVARLSDLVELNVKAE
jgi:2-keto-4-pentenoate hydratase/2-oxohepta-3-ene-1,7-dioic acid hydratase in catechol pathway